MMAVLTPGLTPQQKQRLADALRRVAGLPLGSITIVYLDADVAAARGLDYRTDSPVRVATLASNIAAEHHIPVETAACAYGIAVGVRLGRTFAPQQKPRAKTWISEEYKQLTVPNRRDAAKYIRKLLKIQGAPRLIGRAYGAQIPDTRPARDEKPATIEEEIAAAKRLAREFNHVASGAQRRNKRRREDT